MKTKTSVLLIALLLGTSLLTFGQMKGVTVGQEMPEFKAQVYQGGEFDLNEYKGKNVMLIFNRGLVAPNHWCNICQYNYMEMIDFDKLNQLEEKHNLKVAFVLPYGKDTVAQWVATIPQQMKVVEQWKYPADTTKLSEGRKRWMQTARKMFPKDHTIKPEDLKTPITIIADADHKLTDELGLYDPKWDGGNAPQAIPCVFIIDENGVVQFKYVSQNTIDRPSYSYLEKVLEDMIDNQ